MDDLVKAMGAGGMSKSQVSRLCASREAVIAYMDFPREHWPQIASTNPLERVNREIKRRADVVGIFPTTTPSFAWSALSCSRPTTSERWLGAT